MTTILRIGLLVLLLLCASSAVINGASDPKPEESESTKKNKFREREASDDMLGYPNIDEDSLLDTKCPRHIELRWQTEVSSSIYATPLIADINSDGKLEVVVPSFVHYLEVLEGSDGDKLPGWPAFHQSTIHSSPLLYDIDKDANREIVLATYNGVINFFRASGYMLAEKLEVPRRKVRKNWYVGLHPDPVDRSHPDVHDESLVEEASHMNSVSHMNESTSGLNTSSASTSEIKDSSIHTSESVEEVKNGSGQADGLQNNINNATKRDASLESITGESTTGSQRRLLEDTDSKGAQVGTSESHANVDTETHAATVENKEELEEDADASFDIFRDAEDLADEYNYDYDDYVDESMWGDEEWTEAEHEKLEDYVNIDAHIMCTPVIADIDRDGIQEMIVAVSYFFDREYYEKPEHLSELGGIDIGKYVASGIVVFNLDTRQVKWTADLDLSIDTGNFRAYIYSSPTVVDLDGDGNLDILVGTSYGLFYVLDHRGKVREKFPLEMAEIQGPVVAADINDDGKIEMVTADTHGNVAAWTAQGEEIWEVHLKSLVPQGPTIGDVNGDGRTEIVVPTISGNIYVLSGKDGSIVSPFPYRTHGRVMNQVLLVDLRLLLDATQTVLGGASGKFPQYYGAYYELVSAGVQFPQRSLVPSPQLPVPKEQPQLPVPKEQPRNLPAHEPLIPNFEDGGRESNSQTISGSSIIHKATSVLDVMKEVLNALDPKHPEGATDEFILDLVEQCSFQKQRVMHLVMTSRDEKVVTQAIELNEQLHKILIQHDALLSVRSTSNAVSRNGEEEEEDAELLFRRIRKGKACAEEHSEDFVGSARFIPEDKMRRPLSIQPVEPDSKPLPTVSIPPPATTVSVLPLPTGSVPPPAATVSVPPLPPSSLPPPPAKHLERERFFKEKQTDGSGVAGHMRDLSVHSRNGSSSRSGSVDLNEFAYRD